MAARQRPAIGAQLVVEIEGIAQRQGLGRGGLRHLDQAEVLAREAAVGPAAASPAPSPARALPRPQPTPCVLLATSLSARGAPSSAWSCAETITTMAAASCSGLVLPLVCVPSGGRSGASAARSSISGTPNAFIARFCAGHAQRHDLAHEAALSCRPLGLEVRVQRVAVLSIPRDAEPPRQLLGGRDRVRRLGAVAVLRLEAHEPRRLEQGPWAAPPATAPSIGTRRRRRRRHWPRPVPRRAWRAGSHRGRRRIGGRRSAPARCRGGRRQGRRCAPGCRPPWYCRG